MAGSISIYLILYVLFSFLLNGIVIAGNDYIAKAADSVFAGNQLLLSESLLPLVLLVLAGALSAFIKSLSGSTYSTKKQQSIRNRLQQHLMELPFSYFDEKGTGSIMNKLVSDIAEVGRYYSEILPEFIVNIITVVMITVYLIHMDARLTAILFAGYPIMLAAARHLSGKLKAIAQQMRSNRDDRTEIAYDAVSGIVVGRSFQLYPVMKQRIDRVIDAIAAHGARSTRISSMGYVLEHIMTEIPLMACYLFALYETLTGAITTGEMLAFTILLGRIIYPLGRVVFCMTDMKEAGVSIERIRDILRERPEADSSESAEKPEERETESADSPDAGSIENVENPEAGSAGSTERPKADSPERLKKGSAESTESLEADSMESVENPEAGSAESTESLDTGSMESVENPEAGSTESLKAGSTESRKEPGREHALRKNRAASTPAEPTAEPGAAVRTPAIVFSDVQFSYEEGRPVLEHLTFTVEQGEKAAFAGSSGGGKSTVFKLLCGLYRPQSGSYWLFGRDFREWDLQEARKCFSIVSQNVFLFPDTIYNNVACGKENAAPEEVYEACRCANIHTFIMGLPQGYNTPTGERGVKLSGGEKQRISIARAFLKDAPILLMDEPTSAVDEETEVLIQEALDKISEGKTVLIIAHRLSTIREADKIMVMQHGRIAETGTHEALLRRKGAYAELYEKALQTSC